MVADLAFIDGGHSVATIDSDYRNLQDCRAVVFDDYYLPLPDGRIHIDTKLYGCNKVVDEIGGCEIFSEEHQTDSFNNVGTICLAVRYND
jgi:hypothetical protein